MSCIEPKLPITFTPYKESITFASEERAGTIQMIAERISSIYAEFLTLNKHKQRDQTLVFHDFPEKFPSEESMVEFREALKQAIISKINKGHREIFLTTLKSPQGLLKKVILKLPSLNEYPIDKFFPQNAGTTLEYLHLENTFIIRIDP